MNETDQIFEEILRNLTEGSHSYHARHDNGDYVASDTSVHNMSDEQLTTFVRRQAEEKLKSSGLKMNVIDFYRKVAACVNDVRLNESKG